MRFVAALIALFCIVAPARAEVTAASPSAFVIQAEADVAASPAHTRALMCAMRSQF